jgi:hypothetical protein
MRAVAALALLAWTNLIGSALAQTREVMTFEEAKQRADNGDAFAQAVVALHYQLGWNTEKNPELAAQYALASANAGEPLGRFRLGALLRAGEGVAKDEEQGVAYQAASFNGLATAQDPYSITSAAIMIFQGKVVGQNVPQDQRRKNAANLYRDAADMRYAPAQFNYAMCADAGHGIPQSISVRNDYLMRAKHNGYPLAEAYFKELGEWFSGDIGGKKTLLRLEWGKGDEVRGWYFTPYGSDAETTAFLKGKKNESKGIMLEAFTYGKLSGTFDLLTSGSQNESRLEGQFRRSDGQTEPAMFSVIRQRQSAGAGESVTSYPSTDSEVPDTDDGSIAPIVEQTMLGEDVHVVAQISQTEYPVADENPNFEVRVGKRRYSRTRNIYIHDKKTGLMLTSVNTDPEGIGDIKGIVLAKDSSFVAVQFWTSIGAGGGVKVYGLDSGVLDLKAQHWSFGEVLGIDEANQALYIDEGGKILKSKLFDSEAEPVVVTNQPLLTTINRVDAADDNMSESSSMANIIDGYWTSVDFETNNKSIRLVRRIEGDLGLNTPKRGLNSGRAIDLLSLDAEHLSEVHEMPTEREVAQRYTEFYESIHPDREMDRGGSTSVYARQLGGDLVATYFDWFRLGDCGPVDSGLWAVVEKSGNQSEASKLLLVPEIHDSVESRIEADQHVSRSKEFIEFIDPLVPPVALSGGVRTGFPVLREQGGRLVCKDDSKLLLFGDDLKVEKVLPWHGSKKAVSVNIDQSLAAGLENASLEMNAVQIFDVNSRKVVGRLYAKQSAAAFLCEDGLYMNRGPVDSLVAFRKGKRTYPFEQFDLRLNRPDIVLERLGAPAEAVGIAKQLREKRLKRMGVTEEMLQPDFHVPELEIVGDVPVTTDADEINLAIKASDSKYPLERLRVYVNNVPVNGRDGESLSDQNTQTLERTIPIKLAAGMNKIQVSVLNGAGAESLYANAEVNCTAQRPKPTLYAVALGVSDYAKPDWNLKYAAKDARDVLERLKTRSGASYGEVKELLLTDKQVTKDSLAQIKDFLKDATIDDTVLMFVAGHGLLDSNYDYYFGTTDIDFNNPAEQGIAFEEFDDLLAGLPSLKKSLLIDTCHAGELDEEEKTLLASAGGTAASLPTGNGIAMRSIGTRGMNVKAVEGARGASEWYDRLQGLFVDLRRGSGSTILSSSAGAEYALESSEQQNGLFTYAVLEALDGKKEADSDKDGSIEMSELGEYVKKRVSELTNNKQTPNTRRVNLEGDFTLAKTE